MGVAFFFCIVSFFLFFAFCEFSGAKETAIESKGRAAAISSPPYSSESDSNESKQRRKKCTRRKRTKTIEFSARIKPNLFCTNSIRSPLGLLLEALLYDGKRTDFFFFFLLTFLISVGEKKGQVPPVFLLSFLCP